MLNRIIHTVIIVPSSVELFIECAWENKISYNASKNSNVHFVT